MAWLGAANPEWESALENGVRGCVAWKVGGAGGGWLAGWLDGRMGLGRRSVAVLILGQVTRVGTTGAAGVVTRRAARTGGDGLGVSNAGWLARNTPLHTYPAGLTQNITLQIG